MTTRVEHWNCTAADIEAAIESVLAAQLLQERMRTLPHELEREAINHALNTFQDWADYYELPTTPHVLAAFLLELAQIHHADPAALRFIAGAYMGQHHRDVEVPVNAALNYCCSARERAGGARTLPRARPSP
jgi:hypothetical protein